MKPTFKMEGGEWYMMMIQVGLEEQTSLWVWWRDYVLYLNCAIFCLKSVWKKKKEEANCHLTHEYISKVYEIKVLKMNKRRENAWFCFLYVVERGVFVGT